MAPDRKRLLVISPVFNEAANLERTARSVATQLRPPDRWLVVDDGSSDETVELARRWERELDFMTVIEAPAGAAPGADNLALAREAHAFNFGLEQAGWRQFEFVGKLDGDVEIPSKWFATLIERFDQDASLGLAGGRLAEADRGGWKTIPIPPTHVHGAVKLFRRNCLEAIGGIPERLAWDTIDETYARMHGFETRSFADLVAFHHRPWGSADGRLRGRARHGECAWILHYGFAWVLLRSLKVARVPPVGLSGAAFLYGYLRAAARRVPRVEDRDFRSFVRAELRTRMLRPLRGSGRKRGEPRANGMNGVPARNALGLAHVGTTESRPLADAAIRLLDVVGAACLLVLLAPLLLAVAALVKLDSRGPAIFRQERLGRRLRPFSVAKFRTMREGAEADPHRAHVERMIAEEGREDRPMTKLKEDDRVTRVGSFLRRTSIDELPQLWNVLRGEMSLVGPRPSIQYEVDRYPDEAFRRFAVRPGLTGLWQVQGRSLVTFRQMIEFDCEYVERRSLPLNLKILVLTVPTVLHGKGAA